MRTLADVVNSSKTAEIKLEDCVIVKENKNGTYNVVFNLNNKRVFVNYINLNLCKDNKLTIKYGKKEESWTKAYWYQIEPEEPKTEETEEKEEK